MRNTLHFKQAGTETDLTTHDGELLLVVEIFPEELHILQTVRDHRKTIIGNE